MDTIGIDRAVELTSAFRGKNVTVVGDSMLDQWIWGSVSRISPEAPVPVVDVERLSYTPGGAANVVNNMESLGGNVSVFTVTGDDESASRLSGELERRGVDVSGIVRDPGRPTTTKTRIVANSQQLCRTDTEMRTPVSGGVLEALRSPLAASIARSDVCVLSDYNKGLFSPELFSTILSAAAEAGVMIVTGPKPANIELFRGSHLMTLNEKEAREAGGRLAGGMSITGIGEGLRSGLGLEALLVTRGDKGMVLFESGREPFSIPALASEVYDVSGAGDTVLSVAALALSAGASFREAVVLANFAAAVVVKKVGTATVSVPELVEMIEWHAGKAPARGGRF